MKTEAGLTFIDAFMRLKSSEANECSIFKKFYLNNGGFKIKLSTCGSGIINSDIGEELKTIPTEWLFSGHDWCIEYSDSNGL